MTQIHKRKLVCFSLGICGVLALALNGHRQPPVQYQQNFSSFSHSALLVPRPLYSTTSENDALHRVAKRFQKRLWKHLGTVPSLATIERAVQKRHELFKRNVSLSYKTSREDIANAVLDLYARPLWIRLDFGYDRLSYVFDEERIRSDLKEYGLPGITLPRDITVTVLTQDNGNPSSVAEGEGFARGGYVFDVENIFSTLLDAFLSQKSQDVIIPVTYRNGKIVLQDAVHGKDAELTLLASGRSNFHGSPYGRIQNIHKAVKEHLHHRVIPAGEEFSFNAILGGPVTLSRGWHEALGIFNSGMELRPTPGGGICQVSTTLYRAILFGGFPVLQRRSHSLYVTYYKKYGVGLDATIFPGSQDLVFLNDTPGNLIIQATVENADEIVVNIYGIPDGRTVALEGPYMSENAPDDLRVNGRRLTQKEIAWKQQIRYNDGRIEENVILSYYRESFSHQQLLANLESFEMHLVESL
ncbi:hypothetical protein A3D11_01280 [Candidatus Peribacteria bacterium RIFCSPHIGHO2_02_FULL_49_16]|nr:MAG: hypothetical protein A2880_02405 [Candidatus Peribacteria bacterium RIFCSPHIGHO2_01_FULL_49_38]OGJ59580.1 MAG: hypothetical protein A3D11_01280 [Candidatus Peribacteria bacterium RIFCSPHIGHO2_02_FULL_49_16]